MKLIFEKDKCRIELFYKRMKAAGLNINQLELLEVNLENLLHEKNKERIISKKIVKAK